MQVNFLENSRREFYPSHAGYKYSLRTRRNNTIIKHLLLFNVKYTAFKIKHFCILFHILQIGYSRYDHRNHRKKIHSYAFKRDFFKITSLFKNELSQLLLLVQNMKISKPVNM